MNTNPRTDSSLLTLDPRFECVRIQCADTVGSCARGLILLSAGSTVMEGFLCPQSLSRTNGMLSSGQEGSLYLINTAPNGEDGQ